MILQSVFRHYQRIMDVQALIIFVTSTQILVTHGFLFDFFFPHNSDHITTTKAVAPAVSWEGCNYDSDCRAWWCDDLFYGIKCLRNHSFNLFTSNPKVCCCTERAPIYPQDQCSKTVLPKHNVVKTISTTTSPAVTFPPFQPCHQDTDCSIMYCKNPWKLRCVANHLFFIPFPGRTCVCTEADSGTWNLYVWPKFKTQNSAGNNANETSALSHSDAKFPTMKGCNSITDCNIVQCPQPWVIKCIRNRLFYESFILPGNSCVCANATTGEWNMFVWPRYKSVQHSTKTTSTTGNKITHSLYSSSTVKQQNSIDTFPTTQAISSTWTTTTAATTTEPTTMPTTTHLATCNDATDCTSQNTKVSGPFGNLPCTSQRMRMCQSGFCTCNSTFMPTTVQISRPHTSPTETRKAYRCHQCGSENYPCSSQQLFDQTIQPSECPGTEQYCMTDIHQREGSIFVYKRCVSKTTCIREWLQESSDLDYCVRLNKVSKSGSFDCHFCCVTEGCNSGIVPNNNTLYIGQK